MKYENSSNYFGNKAVIAINKNDTLYFDTAMRMLCDCSIDEIIKSETPGIALCMHDDDFVDTCAIWIEDNEWFPIVKFSEEDKYYLLNDGDWYYQHVDDREFSSLFSEYFKNQLSLC